MYTDFLQCTKKSMSSKNSSSSAHSRACVSLTVFSPQCRNFQVYLQLTPWATFLRPVSSILAHSLIAQEPQSLTPQEPIFQQTFLWHNFGNNIFRQNHVFKLGPKSVIFRISAKNHAESTKNQPKRPILSPVCGLQTFLKKTSQIDPRGDHDWLWLWL